MNNNLNYSRREFLWQSSAAVGAAAGGRYNVLLLASDDLRPALGCYGDAFAKTPNLDRLARRGLTFERAYCQQALCGPSRASLLTGLRPDTTRVYSMNNNFRPAVPNAVTLPELFKRNGYQTESIGKVFHGSELMSDHQSWSVPERFLRVPVREHYAIASNKAEKEGPGMKRDYAESADVPDPTYPDGRIADDAVQTLRRLKDRRFFLGVGFVKPHLPFAAPKRYWDMFDRSRVSLVKNPDQPKGMPPIALMEYSALRSYPDVPDRGRIPEAQIRRAVHGYYAATTFMDHCAGRVLDELERLGLYQNTIIVFFGDHGFHLGEQDYWGKTTNFEVSARAPLIVYVPGMRSAGRSTRALVEFVDIYPTVAQLCGLKAPPHHKLEGVSFVPQFENPQRPWKSAAFTQNARQSPAGAVMGYSMRTDRYRYTEWVGKDRELFGIELYDYEKDPLETTNFAGVQGNEDLVASLRQQLRAGWRSAVPKQ